MRRRLLLRKRSNLYNYREAEAAAMIVPQADIWNALGDGIVELSSTMLALHREGLVRERWSWMEEFADRPSPRRLHVEPTASGSELFLWGHGVRADANAIWSRPDIELVFLTDVPDMPNSRLVHAAAEEEGA
jgi:hypothetical protein